MRSSSLRSLITGILLLVVFITVLAAIQFSTPNLPDNDGYYHIKMAYLMRMEGLKPAFPWLPLTILSPAEYYDHHFLFHVALIPFTFGDLRLGAKWAAVLFASLTFLTVWWLFKRQRIPYAGLWALGLLAVSEAFLYRLSITRAQSLSLAVLVMGMHWLINGKHLRLIPLGFIYVWLYNAFPLLPVIAGLYVVAQALVDRRLNLRPVVYATAGVGLGLLINPYFPDNIVFAVQHILPKLTETTAVSVGNEWYPYDTNQLLFIAPLALLACFSGCMALGLAGRRIQVRTLFALLLVGMFGLMLLQSRRFVEYFPAFALIFAALAWAPLLEPHLAREAAPPAPTWTRHWPALALLLVGLPFLVSTFNGAQVSIGASRPYQTYAGASDWLTAHTPSGSRVFQTDWDDFPRLFYYNTHNTYLIGLDPTYLQLADPDLYEEWVRITRGVVKQPSTAITERFGAQFVISDLLHSDFIQQAAADPGMVEVYRDEYAVVYEVR